MTKTVADILKERNTRIASGEYLLWFDSESSLWTISRNKHRARHITVEFETEVEHQAVERFLAMTDQ